MISFDKNGYYETLEVRVDATPEEIRDAYFRSKAAYRKDSVALYSLMSESETEGMLREIEEAYLVLSNPARRKEYDRQFGVMVFEPAPENKFQALASTESNDSNKVVSIDRVPPMDFLDSGSELLIPPCTDFTNPPESTPVQPTSAPNTPPMARAIPSEIQIEIENEKDWTGVFLKKVREARKIPIEELSRFTKINKNYLIAIECDNFSKLPAPVYLRGFITQIARYLRLPTEQVVSAYMTRVKTSL